MTLAAILGCSSTPDRGPADAERAVRDRFAELQAALKAHDVDALWSLLDAKSYADAEQAATALKASYAKVSAEAKAEQEMTYGLPGAELAELSGKGFLKTKRFSDRYREVPDSKVDKVVVEGAKATVHFREEDGDKEQMPLVRQDGTWKISLKMPAIK